MIDIKLLLLLLTNACDARANRFSLHPIVRNPNIWEQIDTQPFFKRWCDKYRLKND